MPIGHPLGTFEEVCIIPNEDIGGFQGRGVCAQVGLRGDNRWTRPLIYRHINAHGSHQRSDADEQTGSGMKNGDRNVEVKE